MTASAHSHPTPVFVLGWQRSGTTWLANILANHPGTIAVQSEDHFGVHESIFFSHFARAYGDLRDEANFRRFAADFTTSDYYLLTGLPPEFLIERRPRSYPEAFRAVMEEMARQRGDVEAWIEKSPQHTLLGEELSAAFPDARFVGIVRRPQGVIASHLWLDGQPPAYPSRLVRLLGLSLTCSVYERWLARFCRDHDECYLTSYEVLAADSAAETERICTFIGIEFEPAMLDVEWGRNTSFKSPRRSAGSLTTPDRQFVAAALTALRLIPLPVLRALVTRRHARRGIEWPPWCWRRRDAGIAV
ncbi:MAG: sulfotransferase [bacterium]